ncbi:hypothetical protein BCR34DRAFT_574149 [Clohesyomyces aquaticus]|uniref:Uncharacterized protein n=1 Tax=Clohesyomyces aquaticus TaxID=1231657 RepID=A0A1Y1YWM3_9PLEO|nr:hypothetical protein BCR34DRAFT_574149 [Clohesyomyces aquaticus]
MDGLVSGRDTISWKNHQKKRSDVGHSPSVHLCICTWTQDTYSRDTVAIKKIAHLTGRWSAYSSRIGSPALRNLRVLLYHSAFSVSSESTGPESSVSTCGGRRRVWMLSFVFVQFDCWSQTRGWQCSDPEASGVWPCLAQSSLGGGHVVRIIDPPLRGR